MEEPIKAEPNRMPDGTFGPNNNANPNGRPKTKTIKERVKEWLDEHPDDMSAFVEHFVRENKELAWQMLEGRPQQDVTTAGEKLPTPIYGGISVQEHTSDEANIPTQETS